MSDFENLDYYDLLGVARSASFDEIKRAYRREISKYHPDRFGNATAEQQAYASLRSQHLTEAYAVLSDFAARTAYNRGQTPDLRGPRAPRPSAPAQQRDHQAELYEQALAHMSAGRLLQAIGALRQLQQINPFYRDSAELLSAAESQLNRRAEQPQHPARRPLLLIGGLVGSVVVIAVAVWALNARGGITAGRTNTSATESLAVAATDPATRMPEPAATAAPTSEPATLAPSEAPSAEPTAEPTSEPTAEPTSEPTAAPPPAPTAIPTSVAEAGAVLLADDFSSPGWADLRGPVWQVGYQGRQYRIGSNAGSGPIWSYRAAPQKDVSIGVDLQVVSGEGGLILRFLDASNYLNIVLNPSQTSYRLEQQSGGATTVLAGGQSEAIRNGANAINRLVVRMRGNHVQVFANGQQLAEADANNAPDTLRYGLLTVAKETAAETLFDNLEIRTLE